MSQQFRDKTPGASEELNEALADVQAKQTSARLGVGADYIVRGSGAQVAATDSVTTSALRDLQRDTEEALARANEEAVGGEQQAADPNAELVAELQSLRRQLPSSRSSRQPTAKTASRISRACSAGTRASPGSSRVRASKASKASRPGQQGQQGQGQQATDGQGQANAAGGNRRRLVRHRNNGFGPGGRGGWYDPRRGGIWDPRNRGLWQNPQACGTRKSSSPTRRASC